MRLKLISTALVAFAVVLSLVAPAVAQEGEARVIDEVVAQVNNDVITLSMIKREMKEAVTTVQQLLGHRSAVTTLSIYAHGVPDSARRAVGHVGQAFGELGR